MLLKDETKVKFGVYKMGSHIRIIGECDLVNQENWHKDEAFYFQAITFVRDPRNAITDEDLAKFKMSVLRDFKNGSFAFKTKIPAEAAKYIEIQTRSWETIRELSEA